MKAVRAGIGGLGIVAMGLAGGTVLLPDIAAAVDVGAVAANDYLLVVPLGLAAAAVMVGTLASRTVRGVDQATPPEPEGVPTADPPGTRFDRLVSDGWRAAPTAFRERTRLRGRLREAAIRTVMRRERCTRAAARRLVETGEWTDDPVAAGFLTEVPHPGSLGVVVTALLTLELPLQRRARRTARAIAREGRGDPA